MKRCHRDCERCEYVTCDGEHIITTSLPWRLSFKYSLAYISPSKISSVRWLLLSRAEEKVVSILHHSRAVSIHSTYIGATGPGQHRYNQTLYNNHVVHKNPHFSRNAQRKMNERREYVCWPQKIRQDQIYIIFAPHHSSIVLE